MDRVLTLYFVFVAQTWSAHKGNKCSGSWCRVHCRRIAYWATSRQAQVHRPQEEVFFSTSSPPANHDHSSRMVPSATGMENDVGKFTLTVTVRGQLSHFLTVVDCRPTVANCCRTVTPVDCRRSPGARLSWNCHADSNDSQQSWHCH